MSVVTRFPPSPTGYLHIGGARTALFNWLFARQQNGKMVLRIEDTDRERSTEEAVAAIFEGMDWLGLDYDEGPFYQSKRFDRYGEVIGQLLEEGKAYHCYCSKERLDALRAEQMANKQKPRYDGLCRARTEPPQPGETPVVRFKTPEAGEIVIDDQVRGRVTVANSELDDLIIARSDCTPTYHLTVVVDDIDMETTHVIRGDDHLNNTPRQIHILEALGADRPVYAHVPMINGPDGKKLSKRHGAVSVTQYRDDGFLPEAMLNYLARLGWSHGDQEIFSVEELIEKFSIAGINHSAAGFDLEKLLWLNQHYIQTLPLEVLCERVKPYFDQADLDVSNGPDFRAAVDAQRERSKTLLDIVGNSAMFYGEITLDEKAAKKHLRPMISEPLAKLRDEFGAQQTWSGAALHKIIEAVAASFELNMGKVAQPLRVAITGSGASPSIDVTLDLVGRERTLARLDKALEYIKIRAEA
ncbi:MAG: glutamate--tRNA ligase [Gammaproteobacteria bacterium]